MNAHAAETTRAPAVAALLYRDEPKELQSTVDSLLAAAATRAQRSSSARTKLKALSVSHAGYVYSGEIAATAYALLASRILQRTLGDFTLVPLVVGGATPTEVAQVLEALWGSDEALIVISSDLSHSQPYETVLAAGVKATAQSQGFARSVDVKAGLQRDFLAEDLSIERGTIHEFYDGPSPPG